MHCTCDVGVLGTVLSACCLFITNCDCYYHALHVCCRRLLQKIANVTIDDLHRVGSQYIAALFDPAKSKVVICCHPMKVNETVTELSSR